MLDLFYNPGWSFPPSTEEPWTEVKMRRQTIGGMGLLVPLNIVEPLTYTCPERMLLSAIFRPDWHSEL